jgi:glycosyltransferase involved in cell wall biosynthesis
MLITIIIPIFNEFENISLLIDKLLVDTKKLPYRFEIILVDDGSNDGSYDEVLKAAKKYSQLKTIKLRRNYGQTAALMAGIDHSNGDILIPMDADLQNDSSDIDRLIKKINEGFDVVSGWRKNRKDNFFSRLIPSILANFIISKISGVKLHDYGCSLKAYKRSIIKDIRLYGEMHRFIPIYASWEGARITEIEVKHHVRIYGKSKYGIGRIFKVILDLILIRFMHKAFDKPIHFFGKFGLFSFIISLIFACIALWLKYIKEVSFISTPLPLVTIFFMLSGFIFIFFGLVAELQMRIYYESQSKRPYSIFTKS